MNRSHFLFTSILAVMSGIIGGALAIWLSAPLAVNAQEGVTDIILFNWFDIKYSRKYRADNNLLKFKLQDDLYTENKIIQFQVDGFNTTNIHVYKLGLSKIVNSRVDLYRDVVDNFTSNRIIFQDQIYDPDIEYIAIADNAKLKPEAIEKYNPWKSENPDSFPHLSRKELTKPWDVLEPQTRHCVLFV